MYVVREIRILGVTRLKANVEINDIEEFRRECARTYKVGLGMVKFVYDEKENRV